MHDVGEKGGGGDAQGSRGQQSGGQGVPAKSGCCCGAVLDTHGEEEPHQCSEGPECPPAVARGTRNTRNPAARMSRSIFPCRPMSSPNQKEQEIEAEIDYRAAVGGDCGGEEGSGRPASPGPRSPRSGW